MPLVAIPLAYWAVGGLVVATGATIAWQQSGGPEAAADALGSAAEGTREAFGNLANAMSGANEEADTSTGAATTTDACSTCEDPQCAALYAKMAELVAELQKRRGDMLADRPVSQGGLGMYELYLRDPYATVPDPRNPNESLGNWRGHEGQIAEKQEALRKRINRYRRVPCRGPLPPGTETQMGLLPPVRPMY